MIKVSVIVPVYNVEKYIGKCLDSLVNQTLKDIEIIVVNDGSPDNSQDIIDQYVKRYPKKVKSFIKENGGQGSARNYGIKESTGEYIGYVDSDDYVSLDMFEILYNKAKETNADIVITRDSKVKEDGTIFDNPFIKKLEDNKENSFFGNMGVCNKIYKRDLIISNNILFKDKMWYEDLAFTLKVLINAQKIDYCIDESLYYYLERSGSTMNNSNINKNLDILIAFDDIISYLKDNNKYVEYYDLIVILAIIHIYIATSVRVIRADALEKDKKIIINKLIKYMDNNFNSYKNNKYLFILSNNQTIIFYLLKFKLYFIVKLIFKIKERGNI